MKAKYDVNKTVERMKEFMVKLQDLAEEYDVELGTATFEETKDEFIVINLKEFIKMEDFDFNIEK